MTRAGLSPDSWQRRVLESPAHQIALLCSRQAGKSSVAAALAMKAALLEAPSLVLVTSPSERQSGETIRKVKTMYHALRRPVQLPSSVSSLRESATDGVKHEAAWQALSVGARETALQMHLSNGSRIIGLPGNEDTIRGYSDVSLLIIDEAALVSDDLYRSVRPMLAVSGGRLLALTTPKGQRGWFYEVWEQCNEASLKGEPEPWERYEVKATDCPRITPAFLAKERRMIGDVWFRQEYEVEFVTPMGAVFRGEDVDRILEPCGGAYQVPWGQP